jgi:hypothetical protein
MLEYTRPQKVVLKYHAVLCALKDTGKSIVICVEALSCRLSQAYPKVEVPRDIQ